MSYNDAYFHKTLAVVLRQLFVETTISRRPFVVETILSWRPLETITCRDHGLLDPFIEADN